MHRFIVLIALVATAAAADIELTWDANTESDLSHYRIHRATTAGFTPGPGNLLRAVHAPGGGGEESFLDVGVRQGATYHYRVVAVDHGGNASAPSAVASVVVGLHRRIRLGVDPAPDGLDIEHRGSGTTRANDPAGVAFPFMESSIDHIFGFVLSEAG